MVSLDYNQCHNLSLTTLCKITGTKVQVPLLTSHCHGGKRGFSLAWELTECLTVTSRWTLQICWVSRFVSSPTDFNNIKRIQSPTPDIGFSANSCFYLLWDTRPGGWSRGDLWPVPIASQMLYLRPSGPTQKYKHYQEMLKEKGKQRIYNTLP